MIQVINCGSSKTPAICAILNSLGIENKMVSLGNETLPVLLGAKGIIISGAPILLSKTEKNYLELFKNIFNGVPVLGICFGHQITGMNFGANVYLGKPIRYAEKINILVKDALFAGLPPIPVFSEDHTEGVTLPEGFIHLASSEHYPVEALKHPTKLIYGVQFHPEVSGENGRILIHNFCKMCYS
jgi:GMP synthase (glutamine-hydrolysing)